MTKRNGSNTAASVRQRLLNKSRESHTDFNLILTRYGLERFLYRLSRSAYGARFILKGAMLFPLWGVYSFRSTRDIDLLGFGDNDIQALEDVFREMCQVEVEDDGILFNKDSVKAEDIRDQLEYGGTRIRFTADLAGALISLQVDIGFGDAVTPEAVEADFPTMLDHPAPHLRVYPPETVIAEKFQAMVKLGIANSRMKDFYDIWIISGMFDFDGTTLSTALARTFERRNTPLPMSVPLALTDEFSKDTQKVRQWGAFLNRSALQVDTDLQGVVEVIADFVMPPIVARCSGESFNSSWRAGGPWKKAS